MIFSVIRLPHSMVMIASISGMELAGNPFALLEQLGEEEGLFIERSAATDTTITLFGEVPAAPQIATLTESGFLATRHPVATALPDLNIGNENWNDSNGDRVFVWNSAARSWTSYRFLGGTWRNASNFSDASALMIEGDTAVFVGRGLATTPENGAITPSLPFNPFAPSE